MVFCPTAPAVCFAMLASPERSSSEAPRFARSMRFFAEALRSFFFFFDAIILAFAITPLRFRCQRGERFAAGRRRASLLAYHAFAEDAAIFDAAVYFRCCLLRHDADAAMPVFELAEGFSFQVR